MNYKSKYLKYKIKYLNAKQKKIGGSRQIVKPPLFLDILDMKDPEQPLKNTEKFVRQESKLFLKDL